jgi:hypothetical protein
MLYVEKHCSNDYGNYILSLYDLSNICRIYQSVKIFIVNNQKV